MCEEPQSSGGGILSESSEEPSSDNIRGILSESYEELESTSAIGIMAESAEEAKPSLNITNIMAENFESSKEPGFFPNNTITSTCEEPQNIGGSILMTTSSKVSERSSDAIIGIMVEIFEEPKPFSDVIGVIADSSEELESSDATGKEVEILEEQKFSSDVTGILAESYEELEPSSTDAICIVVEIYEELKPSSDVTGIMAEISEELKPSSDATGTLVEISEDRKLSSDVTDIIAESSEELEASSDATGIVVEISEERKPSSDVTDIIAESFEELEPSSDATGIMVEISLDAINTSNRVGVIDIPANSVYARWKEERNIAAALVEIDNLIRYMDRMGLTSKEHNHPTSTSEEAVQQQERQISEHKGFEDMLILNRKVNDDALFRGKREKASPLRQKKNPKLSLSLDALHVFHKFNIDPPLAMEDVAKAFNDLQTLKQKYRNR
ncbi:hypothetical protein KI387_001204 [Taxus chinensis]|uniref:Uncharacterized protein n=1 Tax=Taxus chinensis TaxID=29808 RepID=A0AA38GVH9_TAXCH|nr:hypothetical protein KI387_001204 [Taxus chinensis]